VRTPTFSDNTPRDEHANAEIRDQALLKNHPDNDAYGYFSAADKLRAAFEQQANPHNHLARDRGNPPLTAPRGKTPLFAP